MVAILAFNELTINLLGTFLAKKFVYLKYVRAFSEAVTNGVL